MTIIFSEQEKQWIDKKTFNWTVKEGCPEPIRMILEEKLEMLYKNSAGPRIRQAKASDAMGIAIVQAYTWLTTYRGLMPDEVLESRLNRVSVQAEYLFLQIEKCDSYFVVESMNTVVGFAVCGVSRNEEYPDDGEIQAIYLLKGFQGKEIGMALFERCAEFLRRNGHSHMIVNCLAGNPSMGFYRKMGGVQVGMREDRISGGHVISEHILRFELNDMRGGELR